MTFTVPSDITLKPGQYVRFNSGGRFLRVEGYLTNGLGFIFQVQPDLTLVRVFY